MRSSELGSRSSSLYAGMTTESSSWDSIVVSFDLRRYGCPDPALTLCRKSVTAGERHEAALVQNSRMNRAIAALHQSQILKFAGANRDYEPTAFCKLVDQRLWHSWRRGSHNYRVVRRGFTETQRSVRYMYADIGKSEASQPLGCGGRECGAAFKRMNKIRKPRKNRGGIAGTGSNL